MGTCNLSWVLLTNIWYPAAANSPANAQNAPSAETSVSLAVARATPPQMGTRVTNSLKGKTTCSAYKGKQCPGNPHGVV